MSVLYQQGSATSVPDIADLTFDLDTMECFEDIDIKLEDLDSQDESFGSEEQMLLAIDQHSPDGLVLFEFDRMRDLSLQSLELSAAAAATTCRGKRALMLEDMDGGRNDQLLRQDCMWSSVHNQSAAKFFKTEAVGGQEAGRRTVAVQPAASSSASLLGLTPPTSYMHKHLLQRHQFETPLAASSGDEDVSSSSGDDEMMDDDGAVSWWSNSLMDAVSRLSAVPVISAAAVPMVASRDHSYFSSSSSKKSSSFTTSDLTPPESSEDEDSFQGVYVSRQTAAELTSSTSKTTSKLADTKFMDPSSSTGRAIVRSTEPKFTFRINIKSTAATKKLTRLARPSQRRHHLGGAAAVDSDTPTAKASSLRLHSSPGREDEPRRMLRVCVETKGPRDIHNLNERQRRTDLKNAFEYLKFRVPDIASSDRVSKQMILDKAIGFCRSLKTKEAGVRQHHKLLVERNELLRKKLESLKVSRN